MKPDETSIEDKVAKLPHRVRARLALRLIESLEPGDEDRVDEIWLDEAERRLEKYDQGGTEARGIEEAISEIERRLK